VVVAGVKYPEKPPGWFFKVEEMKPHFTVVSALRM
jgi:hypothetical protein